MRSWVQELYKDLFFCILVLTNWILTGLVADYVAFDDTHTKQVLSIWVAIFSVGINAMSFVRSFSLIGSPNAPPESLVGLWSEVVNLTQMWGALFCLVRYFSLSDTHAFFQQGLLSNLGESVWEMGFVQAGVGYVAVTPTTFGERMVAWLAAYVGGVFASSMFFASVVLGRRAHWERPKPEEKALLPMDTSASASAAWRVTFR
tara:strand:+ start:2941 stop:3549 length:609 start_codon:yes stop_codon:yes gene_type:complete